LGWRVSQLSRPPHSQRDRQTDRQTHLVPIPLQGRQRDLRLAGFPALFKNGLNFGDENLKTAEVARFMKTYGFDGGKQRTLGLKHLVGDDKSVLADKKLLSLATLIHNQIKYFRSDDPIKQQATELGMRYTTKRKKPSMKAALMATSVSAALGYLHNTEMTKNVQHWVKKGQLKNFQMGQK
jgi:hypothetical protein